MSGFAPHTSIIVITILVSFALAYAANSREDTELLELENQRYQAMVDRDLELLDSILADDLIFTHASSKIDTKESFMNSLRSGNLTYKAIEIEDVEVRMHGSCSVVTGRSFLDIHVRGEDRKLKLRFTTVWVEDRAGWKVVAYQSTRASE